MEIRNLAVAVLGATGDMGRAIANMLARDGARLAISGRDPKKLGTLKTELEGVGATVFADVVDVTEEVAVGRFFERAVDALGPLAVLVYTPGLSVPGKIPEMDATDVRRMLEVNVEGAFFAAKHFVGQVDPAAGGLAILLSSVAAKRANPNAPIYCASKAALAMMADGLALQAAARNVRVTTLSPGAADTQFWGNRSVPREKFLRVDEVAEVVRFVLQMPSRVVFHDIVFEPFDFFKTK